MALKQHISEEDINRQFINIDKIAEMKGLKSNRSLRVEINKGEKSKYISREVNTKGGKTYEILITTLEPELQLKIIDERIRANNLVTLNNHAVSFESQKARLEALARIDIVNYYLNFRKRYSLQKTAISDFLSMYNCGQLLPKIFKTMGTISGATLQRWVSCYQKH